MTFGERLHALRKMKHLQQKELGQLIGKAGDIVSKYERNQMEPSISMAVKFAEALNVSLDFLVRGTEFNSQEGSTIIRLILQLVESLSPENQLHAIAVLEGLHARQQRNSAAR